MNDSHRIITVRGVCVGIRYMESGSSGTMQEYCVDVIRGLQSPNERPLFSKNVEILKVSTSELLNMGS